MGYIINDECIACGTCAEVCQNDAIKEENDTYVITSDCIDCGECVDACPVGAIVEE